MNIHMFFDLLAAIVSLTVTYYLSRTILASNLRKIETIGNIYYVGLTFGAIWGAFALGTLNLRISGIEGLGKSILGAFVGAILMTELAKYIVGYRQSTGALFVPAFTISTIIGRWGCFFTGLPDQTYGKWTDHTFGVDFGDGPRHPVQLYESGAMFFALLIWVWLLRRHPTFFRDYGFYLLCVYYGGQRFILEFVKPYGSVIGSFNVFHLFSFALVGYGICMITIARRQA